MKITLAALMIAFPLSACGGVEAADPAQESAPGAVAASAPTKLSVGRMIFFDARLSEPAGQSCATCHDPAVAFSDGRPGPTSRGAVTGRFGVRNTPSINYASYTPALMPTTGEEGGYAGGLFLDGRTPTLEAQVASPLLSPLEMNNPDKAAVVNKIKLGPYAAQFKQVFGSSVFSNVNTAFARAAEAIAEYERKGIPGRFTSKFDAYVAGKATLSAAEQRGLDLFQDTTKGNCAFCHIDTPGDDGTPALFTDFGFDNIGLPKNPDNPFYKLPPELNPLGDKYIDYGLSVAIRDPRQAGRFKAPTLRNIALTAPYGHNGFFTDLPAVVHFYNTRDVEPWAAPELADRVNKGKMGDLKLSPQEESDLVEFMLALTDGYL